MASLESDPSAPGEKVEEVARLALKLGVTAFGGPAAHIAMLRQEVVDRRSWMSQQHFVDLIGITNLIPGPNSTEMVMHVGYERAGRRGLIAAGTSFIVPAALITLCFAVVYEKYGSTPSGEHLLYGIKPVVLAVILQAIWGLGRTAITSLLRVILFAAIVGLYQIGISELILLFGGMLAFVLATAASRALAKRTVLSLSPAPLFALIWQSSAVDPQVPYSAARLFWQFLKIGATLYGSGYVLIAFLQSTFVDDYGWLTEAQLLDAVAVGQLTPGPVFTTATFVGYLTGGFPGAVLATVAIFIPSFLFVAMINPLLPRLRERPWLSVMLDGVSVAALALMTGVAIQLASDALVDPLTIGLFVLAGGLLIVRNVNSAILIILGGAIGLLSWLT